jgi:hypothetical protein
MQSSPVVTQQMPQTQLPSLQSLSWPQSPPKPLKGHIKRQGPLPVSDARCEQQSEKQGSGLLGPQQAVAARQVGGGGQTPLQQRPVLHKVPFGWLMAPEQSPVLGSQVPPEV